MPITEGREMIRIGLVDDHIIVRAGLKQYLGEPDFAQLHALLEASK